MDEKDIFKMIIWNKTFNVNLKKIAGVEIWFVIFTHKPTHQLGQTFCFMFKYRPLSRHIKNIFELIEGLVKFLWRFADTFH